MHAKLQIEGLTRAAEAGGIERHLFHEAGVIHVSVNPDTGIAYVIYDHDRVQAATLRRAVEQVGFGAVMI